MVFEGEKDELVKEDNRVVGGGWIGRLRRGG